MVHCLISLPRCLYLSIIFLVVLDQVLRAALHWKLYKNINCCCKHITWQQHNIAKWSKKKSKSDVWASNDDDDNQRNTNRKKRLSTRNHRFCCYKSTLTPIYLRSIRNLIYNLFCILLIQLHSRYWCTLALQIEWIMTFYSVYF